MAILTQSQVYSIALAAGLPNPKLMAAIAMAESSGRTDVVNSIGAVGLWQINQPVHVKSHPTWTVAYLKNPMNNALAAKVILNSQGLRAWEAYTNGAYKRYYSSTVTQADVDIDNFIDPYGFGDAEGFGSDLLSGLDAAKQGLEVTVKTAAWIANPKNWIRIAYVTGGVLVVLVGLNMVSRNAILDKIPMGKVASLAKGAKGA